MGATSSKRKNGVNPYPLALGAPAAGMPPGFQPQGTLMQAPHFLAGAQNPYQPAYPNQIFTSTYQPGFRRKRNRQKREIQGVQPIFGFVPPGFQPQAMPPVVPAQMPIPQPPPPPPIAPSSSGAPPPLFTPGNGAQLRGFPSPFPDGGQGDTSGTSRRPQTPFLPPLDGRYEAQDDSNRRSNNPRHSSRHRRHRTSPSDLQRSASQVEEPPRIRLEIVNAARENPLPEPPRNVYELDYKQVLDLPGTKTLLTTNYENLRPALPALLQAIASRPADQPITTLPLRQATHTAPAQAQAQAQPQPVQDPGQKEKKGGLFHKLSVRRSRQETPPPAATAAPAATTVPIPTSSQNPPIIFYPLVLPNPAPPAAPLPETGNQSNSRSHSRSQSRNGSHSGHSNNGSRHRGSSGSGSHRMSAPHIPTPPPFNEPVIPEGIPMHDDELSPIDSGDEQDDDGRRSHSPSRSGSYRSSEGSEISGSTHPTSYHPDSRQGGMLPALYFQQMGEYSGFLNHSEHRIMYRNKTYPSAAHLWEAMKYLDRRPDLAEMIRMCADFGELFQLTSSEAFRKDERRDWAKVFLKVLEDVVLRKFRQHPDLRSLLLGTGHAPLVYSDTRDGYWGDGPMGSGTNHLGKVLQVVRDRLRNEREPHA